MHYNDKFILQRLARGYFDHFEPFFYKNLDISIDTQCWIVEQGHGEPVSPKHAIGLKVDQGREIPNYQPFSKGQNWGKPWGTAWFKFSGKVPIEYLDSNNAKIKPIDFYIDLGWAKDSDGFQCEGLAYRADGTAIKGINPKNNWFRLVGNGAPKDLLKQDGSFEFFVEGASNPVIWDMKTTGDMGQKKTIDSMKPGAIHDRYIYSFGGVRIVQTNQPLIDLSFDLELLQNLAKQIDNKSTRYWKIIRAIEKSLDEYDYQNLDSTVYNARKALEPVLSSPANATEQNIYAVANSHIDSAWLWPFRETVRKCGRTCANILALMDLDPNIIYAMSSGHQFEWIEKRHPDLFERLLVKIKEGRIIPVGGTWVEFDAVIPSGEALVRHFAYGKQYYRNTLNYDPKIVWLPDSFGYSGALPQLALKSGFDYFLTQKMSWNDTNRFPHHTMIWEGIDGSQVFTHFPPADTYCAQGNVSEVIYSAQNYKDKAISDNHVLLYGFGDGGGGPTLDMVSRINRYSNIEGLPRVKHGNVEEFFDTEKKETKGLVQTWSGEMYFEYHRGTLTSQRLTKIGNRRVENTLRLAEYLATIAHIQGIEKWNGEFFERIWKQLLLCQFHDVIPGSSIGWVHSDAHKILTTALDELNEYIALISKKLDKNDLPVEHYKVIGYNALEQKDLQRIAPDANGKITKTNTIPKQENATQITKNSEVKTTLDNGIINITIEQGKLICASYKTKFGSKKIASNLSKIKDESLALGSVLMAKDEPMNCWDAWDLDKQVVQKLKPYGDFVSQTVSEGPNGSVFVVAKFNPSSGYKSSYQITYTLKPNLNHIGITYDIDFQDSEKYLRSVFPLDINTNSATYETQYGTVSRSVMENTSWDEAQFESCTGRFFHIEDPSTKVGIINNSTYGGNVAKASSNTVLASVSLVRSATFPDSKQDLGKHSIAFGLVLGDCVAKTTSAAIKFNAPLQATAPCVKSPLELDIISGSAVIDHLKVAFDDSGDIIARIYEPVGGKVNAKLIGLLADSSKYNCVEVNLLEEPIDKGSVLNNNNTSISLKAYEVATLRFSKK